MALSGVSLQGSAQQLVQIPERLKVADMELEIREGAKPILEGYVNKLVGNNRYFRQMVDRADAYLPIVERIFQEEGLPSDFRYLVIQESSLVSYLVSTSNAVGYWQFKRETALEMGLRVDEEIDERMSIVPSSRSAARYLIRHNQFMQNWVYSLLAYYAGLGGAKALINPEKIGSKTLEIDENTHWYILKFLAHKIAFEPHLYRNTSTPNLRIMEFHECENKTLEQLSRETNYSLDQLQFYNRWVLKGYIPGDRDYTLILPLKAEDGIIFDSPLYVRASPPVEKLEPWREKILFGLIEKPVTEAEPVVLANGKTEVPVFFDWNGIKAIQAKKGDNSSKLALLAGISREDFLEYNDLRVFDPVVPGEVYYVDNKKNKAKIPFHTVQHGQGLWEIAQKYGIRMQSLMAKNRMNRPEKLKAGRVLWMRHFRPEDEPIRYEAVTEPQPIKPAPVNLFAQEKKKDSLEMKKTEAKVLSMLGSDSSSGEIAETAAEAEAVAQVETTVTAEKSQKQAVESAIAANSSKVNDAKTNESVVSEQASVQASTAIQVPDVNKMPEVINGEITISEGLTWYRISRHYRKSLDSLQAWNGADLQLQAGQKIRLERKSGQITEMPEEPIQMAKAEPAEMGVAGQHAGTDLYEAKPGDSCYGIARKFGMKPDRLLELNGKSSAVIKAGEVLKVEKLP